MPGVYRLNFIKSFIIFTKSFSIQPTNVTEFYVLAIGITSKVNVTQMVQLVTEPFYNHYFRVEEFDQLMQALEFVIAGTCLGLTAPPLTVTDSPLEPITG